MLREILFRGKNPFTKKWHTGLLCHLVDGDEWFISNSHGIATAYKIDPETVGQYTGLTDSNGNKIFEGDIIRYADLYDYECYLESLDNPEAYSEWDLEAMWTVDAVVYGGDYYPAFDLHKHGFDANALSELHESGLYHYEVVGNIHDNPELVKGEISGGGRS